MNIVKLFKNNSLFLLALFNKKSQIKNNKLKRTINAHGVK